MVARLMVGRVFCLSVCLFRLLLSAAAAAAADGDEDDDGVLFCSDSFFFAFSLARLLVLDRCRRPHTNSLSDSPPMQRCRRRGPCGNHRPGWSPPPVRRLACLPPSAAGGDGRVLAALCSSARRRPPAGRPVSQCSSLWLSSTLSALSSLSSLSCSHSPSAVIASVQSMQCNLRIVAPSYYHCPSPA